MKTSNIRKIFSLYSVIHILIAIGINFIASNGFAQEREMDWYGLRERENRRLDAARRAYEQNMAEARIENARRVQRNLETANAKRKLRANRHFILTGKLSSGFQPDEQALGYRKEYLNISSGADNNRALDDRREEWIKKNLGLTLTGESIPETSNFARKMGINPDHATREYLDPVAVVPGSTTAYSSGGRSVESSQWKEGPTSERPDLLGTDKFQNYLAAVGNFFTGKGLSWSAAKTNLRIALRAFYLFASAIKTEADNKDRPESASQLIADVKSQKHLEWLMANPHIFWLVVYKFQLNYDENVIKKLKKEARTKGTRDQRILENQIRRNIEYVSLTFGSPEEQTRLLSELDKLKNAHPREIRFMGNLVKKLFPNGINDLEGSRHSYSFVTDNLRLHSPQEGEPWPSFTSAPWEVMEVLRKIYIGFSDYLIRNAPHSDFVIQPDPRQPIYGSTCIPTVTTGVNRILSK